MHGFDENHVCGYSFKSRTKDDIDSGYCNLIAGTYFVSFYYRTTKYLYAISVVNKFSGENLGYEIMSIYRCQNKATDLTLLDLVVRHTTRADTPDDFLLTKRLDEFIKILSPKDREYYVNLSSDNVHGLAKYIIDESLKLELECGIGDIGGCSEYKARFIDALKKSSSLLMLMMMAYRSIEFTNSEDAASVKKFSDRCIELAIGSASTDIYGLD